MNLKPASDTTENIARTHDQGTCVGHRRGTTENPEQNRHQAALRKGGHHGRHQTHGTTTTFFVVLVLCVLAAPTAGLAHDPGLSTAQIRIFPDRIETEQTLARADLEVLVPFDAYGHGNLHQPERVTVPPALLKLAAEAFRIQVDHQAVAVVASGFHIDATNNCHLTATYLVPCSGPLSIQTALIERLPRGHRQFVTVLDPAGAIIVETLLSAEQPVLKVDGQEQAGSQAVGSRAPRFTGFLRLGVEHILKGYDHLLFLFALLMVTPRFRQAAWIITAFTVAHSTTLALATFDVVRFAPKFVEPLIAASIVYVGIENIVRRVELRGRWLLTFGFGLIHGFGFAGVLRDLGGGSGVSGILLPLFSFNLGVELGQVAVSALALPLIWSARRHPSFARYAMPAGSVLVIIAGGWWLMERTVL
jgi:hydrogenase/urease accessory protein HupE